MIQRYPRRTVCPIRFTVTAERMTGSLLFPMARLWRKQRICRETPLQTAAAACLCPECTSFAAAARINWQRPQKSKQQASRLINQDRSRPGYEHLEQHHPQSPPPGAGLPLYGSHRSYTGRVHQAKDHQRICIHTAKASSGQALHEGAHSAS